MLSVVSLLALSACSNDDSDTLTRVPLTIKATIQGAETRVTPDADGVDQFEVGDVITVYCFDTDVNSDYSTNGVKYTFDGEKWITENPFYFKPNDTGTYIFETYYYVTDDSDKYDYENMIIDQSEGLIGDQLRASTTCSARNPEAAFSFTHARSKITLYFTSVVTECKLIDGSKKTTICHLIDKGKTAEALLVADMTYYLKAQVTTDDKIYTGTINLAELKANTHYIYNIKISDVLTVSENTSIVGFDDGGEIYADQTN
jgi:hypothetical protein